MSEFSHFEDDRDAHMVDVSSKPATRREAQAHAFVAMSQETVAALKKGPLAKGSPFEVARIAGIQAAKRTFEMIPMCHPIGAQHVDVTVALEEGGVRIRSKVVVTAQTGAEMEALFAASTAALTVYDMCKSADREMVIGHVRLESKSGGKSGTYLRNQTTDPTKVKKP